MKKYFIVPIFLVCLIFMCLNAQEQKYLRLSDFPEDIKNSKPYKRYQWNHQQRAYPYKTIPYKYARGVVIGEIEKIRKRSNQSNSLISWYPKGPSFVDAKDYWPNWDTLSGRVMAIAVHPEDHLTVYVGAACGGLWKTTNGGETWMDIGHDLSSMAFGAIAIDPNNPETVYAGSGETMSGIWENIFIGYGMYKTTDGGNTWDTIDDFGEYTGFTDIIVSPFDSNLIYASLASGPFNLGYSLPNEGVWRSDDAGNNWDKVLDLPRVFDLTLHPDAADIVYACVGGSNTASGIYISTDKGETWNTMNNGLPEPEIINRIQLDIFPSYPDIFYAVIHLMADTISNSESTYAYKSINGGSSWFQISEGVRLGGYSIYNGWYDQGWWDLCIAIDPLDSNHVFIGNVELHETTDGQNFSPVRIPGGSHLLQGIAHCDYHQLKFAPSNPDYFYMGCDGGVYLSTDGCNTATARNVGLETILFYRMASHPTNPDIMIAGSQDNGTMLSKDGGVSWKVVDGGDGVECFFNYQNPDIVYASRTWGRLYKSTNGGDNFSQFKNMYGEFVTPFFIHPSGHDTIYSANSDIFRFPHPNGQPGWEQMTTDLSPVLINTFTQSTVNPDHMILAAYNYSYNNPYIVVKISSDGGYNWEDVTASIPGEQKWVSRVKTHPWDENTMFVVRCGYSDGNKIYKTNDLGQTWTNISGNLPNIPCNDLFINPGNSNHYYIGTDLGVYLSEDGGTTYQHAGEGMPLVPIMEFDYSEYEGILYLRVATHGRGIYETTDLETDMRETEILSPGSILAKPNPFTTETLVEYELQRSSFVQLYLYNQLGEKVMEILSEHQANGKHEFKIKGKSLPAGIYFCVLKTNKDTQAQKIIKLN